MYNNDTGFIPEKYIPKVLSRKDRIKQLKNIQKTRRAYAKGTTKGTTRRTIKAKSGIYIDRPILKSFVSKPSKHIVKAYKMYGVSSMKPSDLLSRKTGCSKKVLQKIVNKGEGAYYSSGSRPNQTAQSWGHARLASTLTGGPAAFVDKDLILEGCSVKSPAYSLLQTSKKLL